MDPKVSEDARSWFEGDLEPGYKDRVKYTYILEVLEFSASHIGFINRILSLSAAGKWDGNFDLDRVIRRRRRVCA